MGWWALLFHFAKRGKTASIVAAYARSLSIDAFALLTRIGKFPVQPEQLATGIFTWWRYSDPAFNPRGARRASPLPLNLVLTFCASLVAPVIRSGLRDGLDPVFKMLKKLDVLADPAVLSNTFCTNYPQFPDGHFYGNQQQVQRAANDIMQDPAFGKQFVSEVSHLLRRLLDVDAHTLDPVPLHLVPNRVNPRQVLAYLEKQFQNWRASKDKVPLLNQHLSDLGLRDQAHLSQMLHFLVEGVSMEALGTWLRTHFGRLASADTALHARRFLAVRMANTLLPFRTAHNGRHRPLEEIKQQLAAYAERESALLLPPSRA